MNIQSQNNTKSVIELIKIVVIFDDDIEAGYGQDDDDSDEAPETKTSFTTVRVLTHRTVSCS